MPLSINALKGDSKRVADYYSDVKELAEYNSAEGVGIWGGKAAELLGLRGEVDTEQFIALLDNRHPTTGKQLTARMRKNRRAAYEVTVSVPKSLTLYMEFSGDEFFKRLPVEAFREIMSEIESNVETRVRKNGADHNRSTGNWAFAWFIHKESRPCDGISDPQWHIHAIAPNCTFDAVENCWKALEMGNVKTDASYFQACFNSLLAEKLLAHGYAITPTKTDFELASVSRETIEKFSKRHQIIKAVEVERESKLAEKALTWSKKSGINYGKALGKVKAELGRTTREKKSTALLEDSELRQNWRERMTPEELESLTIDRVKGPSIGFLEAEAAKELTLESLQEVSENQTSNRSLKSKRSREDRELDVAAALLRRGIGRVTVAAAKIWAHLVTVPSTDSKAVAKPSALDLMDRALKTVRKFAFARKDFWMEHARHAAMNQAQQVRSVGMER